MENWRFGCYDDGKEPNLWQRWYDENPGCQGAHDARFESLEQMVPWTEPGAKALNDGLIEVRFKCDNKQWRIFGTYHGRRCFIVVAAGYHKQQVYKPKSVISTAIIRIKQVKNEGKFNVCKRPR